MLPLLALFVLWLALTGRLSVYGELMRTGPGWSIGSIIPGVHPGPHSGLTGPQTGPLVRNPTPPGQGPLDWFWNAIGLGGGNTNPAGGSTPPIMPPVGAGGGGGGSTLPGSGSTF